MRHVKIRPPDSTTSYHRIYINPVVSGLQVGEDVGDVGLVEGCEREALLAEVVEDFAVAT